MRGLQLLFLVILCVRSSVTAEDSAEYGTVRNNNTGSSDESRSESQPKNTFIYIPFRPGDQSHISARSSEESSPPYFLSAPPQPVPVNVQPVTSVEHRVVQSPPPYFLSAPPQPVPVNAQPVTSVEHRVVQSPPAAVQTFVNFVRSPPGTVIHHPAHHHFAAPLVQAPLLQAPAFPPPIVQAPVLQAPVVQAPIVQAPVVHAPVVQAPVVQAPPIVTWSAPAIHRIVSAPVVHPIVSSPVLRVVPHPVHTVVSAPAIFPPHAPPCASPPVPVFAPPLHHHHHHHPPHTFFSPPLAQRTRTVYQQVQFVPEQTHVFSTTSFSPATRTTVYEADHLPAFSAPKARFVKAPIGQRVAPVSAPTDAAATIYTFPKSRVLGAPIRFAGRLSSQRQLRQKIREERWKQKYEDEREKKIFVFNKRNSL